MFLRLLAGFWYLCLAYMLTVLSKVLLYVRYRPLTCSQFIFIWSYKTQIQMTYDIGDFGAFFQEPSHPALCNSTLGCRCFLDLGVLNLALGFCCLSD